MKIDIKIFDIVIIFAVAALTFYAAYSVYLKPYGKLQVLIRGQNNEWTFPLDAEEVITVRGPLGNTIVRIYENQAWIEASPCDNQTCVATGLIKRQSQWAACLPNNVLLLIHGIEENDVDSIAW